MDHDIAGGGPGREYREILYDMVKGIGDDVRSLDRSHRETHDIAREARAGVTDVLRRLEAVEKLAVGSHDKVLELRTVAKVAGRAGGWWAGLLAGALSTLLAAFVLYQLGIGG